MYTFPDGQLRLTYNHNADFLMGEDLVTSFWTDWKERLIVSYHHGGIVFYDLDNEEPISRLPRSSLGNPDLEYSLRLNAFAENICFDGVYLVNTCNRRDEGSNKTSELCLYDFLKL